MIVMEIICTSIGVALCILMITKYFLWIVRRVYIFYISSPINFLHYGKWAVITGCTEGIGKEYAEQLAKLGLNLVLISRSKLKLAAQKTAFEQNHRGIEIKLLVVDFSESKNSIYKEIEHVISDIDIGILVNNVGGTFACHLHECTGQDIESIICVNVQSCIRLTHIILEKYLVKNKGIIINVSSIIVGSNAPYFATYAASKACVTQFSCSLQQEYKHTRIVIQNLMPAYVMTKSVKLAMKNEYGVDTKTFVTQAILTITRLSSTTGCFMHECQRELAKFLPEMVLTMIINYAGSVYRESTLQSRNI